MNKMAEKYAIAFYDLGISPDDFKEMADVIAGDENLHSLLMDPSIPEPKKEAVLAQLSDRMSADKTLRNAVLYLCRHRALGDISGICEALKSYSESQNSILNAALYCVTEPDDGQRARIESWLKKEFNKNTVKLQIINKPEILGGFIIEAEGKQFDWSTLGSLRAIERNIAGQS